MRKARVGTAPPGPAGAQDGGHWHSGRLSARQFRPVACLRLRPRAPGRLRPLAQCQFWPGTQTRRPLFLRPRQIASGTVAAAWSHGGCDVRNTPAQGPR